MLQHAENREREIIYKIHYNLVPQYPSAIANIYRKDNSRYNTRYEDNCIPPRVKYDTYKKIIYSRCNRQMELTKFGY